MKRGSLPERVLLLTTSYPRAVRDFGGHFVRTDARQRAADGAAVRVLAFGDPDRDGSAALDPGVSVRWLGGGSLFGTPGALPRLAQRKARVLLLAWPLARALWQLRERSSYERVVAHFLLLTGWPLGVWFARRRGRAAPAPLEVIAHGSDVRLFERLPERLRRYIARDLRAARAELRFVSAELRTRMGTAAGAPELEHYVLGQAVVPAALELPNLPTKRDARRMLGVTDGERLIVIVGRLTSEKRVDVALGAVDLVPGARVTVIGDGPELESLRQRHPEVSFLGSLEREQALSWMVSSDLLVSASRREGAPTVIREARMLGVPVVAAVAGDLALWASRDAGLSIVG